MRVFFFFFDFFVFKKNKTKNGKRSILVFFIVNPYDPILSTREVAVQQKYT